MIPRIAIDISDPTFKADPFPTYARLRADTPVCRIAISPREEVVILTRYADVSALLKDQRFAKNAVNARTPDQLRSMPRVPSFVAPLTRNILALDDPDHARLRRLVQAVFTPRRIASLEAQTIVASAALLEPLARKRRFDLIADYALPLPVKIISDLLGVPNRDQAKFAAWSHALIKVGSATPMRAVTLMPAILSFLRYLKRLIAMKQADPGDDLVTALVAVEQEGGRLSSDELMAMISILLSAGHETTTNLIGNGMFALMRNTASRDRLHDEPTLIESAIEELLRFEGPVEMSTHRYARETVEIAGMTVPQGTLVMGVIASANRDERHFVEPDTLDIGRSTNRHLTFGEGGHYCLGASLARLEGRIAFRDILLHFPEMRLAVPSDHLRWRRGLVLRGIESLPVETS